MGKGKKYFRTGLLHQLVCSVIPTGMFYEDNVDDLRILIREVKDIESSGFMAVVWLGLDTKGWDKPLYVTNKASFIKGCVEYCKSAVLYSKSTGGTASLERKLL